MGTDVSGNLLSSLPTQLAHLTRMHTLKASHNRLISVGSALATLPLLTRLDLSQNPLLTYVSPAFLAASSALERVDISGCPCGETVLWNDEGLEELSPLMISTLETSVRALHLRGNRLREFPYTEVQKLTLLQELDVSSNGMTGWPTPFVKDTELRSGLQLLNLSFTNESQPHIT